MNEDQKCMSRVPNLGEIGLSREGGQGTGLGTDRETGQSPERERRKVDNTRGERRRE